MTAWQSPETAPKDRMILADVGMPWAAVATWSDYAEKWVLAELEWHVEAHHQAWQLGRQMQG